MLDRVLNPVEELQKTVCAEASPLMELVSIKPAVGNGE
jgi:hypothetical protein